MRLSCGFGAVDFFWRVRAGAACGLLLLVGSCLPTEMPGFSPDGKTIAVVGHDPEARKTALWLYDVSSGTASPHHGPGDWGIINARWFGDEIWVRCSRELGELKDSKTGRPVVDEKGKVVRLTEDVVARFDPAKDDFVPGPGGLGLINLPPMRDEPFAAGFEGQLSLYVPTMESPQGRMWPYDVYSFPSLQKRVGVRFACVLPAGRGCSIRQVTGEGEQAGDLTAVELYDATGARACSIPSDQIASACYRQVRTPSYARVSEDHSVVLLAFGTETIFRRHPRKYTFGVFDASTGRILWAAGSDSMFGTPLVRRGEVWTIEMVDRKLYTGERTVAGAAAPPTPDPSVNRFSMVRYVPPEQKADEGASRDEILTYALPDGHSAGEFAPSPEGAQFVVTDNGPGTGLLMVPIRADAKESDVRSIEFNRR